MANLELVSDDPDIAFTGIRFDADGAFIVQKEASGHEHCVFLSKNMAKQAIAALTAFIEGKNQHASDCALHNSPAEPIGFCDCQG